MNKEQIKATLLLKGIALESEILYNVNNTPYTLSFEKIIDDFFLTPKSQTFFIEGFEKVKDSDSVTIESFFEKMGQLHLMSSLSNKL